MKKNLYLTQIVPHLKEKYGAKKSDSIMISAWKNYDVICAENTGESKAYDMHTKERIYPAIATMQAMEEAGINRQEAIDFLCEYYRWRASGKSVGIKK